MAARSLEAEFYSRAFTGEGLPDRVPAATPGSATRELYRSLEFASRPSVDVS